MLRKGALRELYEQYGKTGLKGSHFCQAERKDGLSTQKLQESQPNLLGKAAHRKSPDRSFQQKSKRLGTVAHLVPVIPHLGGREKRSGVQGQSQLYNEFRTKLGYMRPCFKKTKKTKRQTGNIGNGFSSYWVSMTKCSDLCPLSHLMPTYFSLIRP